MSDQYGSPSKKRTAHCSCGALRVDTVGEPLIVITCFCEECQRRTASAFGISTYWMLENAKPSGAATRYAREGQAGRKVTYYFCPTCGSSVYWELPDRRPGQLGISGGSFFDPNFPAPTMSVWERSKHGWITVPALAHHQENPPPPPDPAPLQMRPRRSFINVGVHGSENRRLNCAAAADNSVTPT